MYLPPGFLFEEAPPRIPILPPLPVRVDVDRISLPMLPRVPLPPLWPRVPLPQGDATDPTLPGGYWSDVNQHPGGAAPGAWGETVDMTFPRPGTLVWVRQDTYTDGPYSHCTIPNWNKEALHNVSRQTQTMGDVTRFSMISATKTTRFLCGSGAPESADGTWGVRIWVMQNGKEILGGDFITSTLRETQYGDWTGTRTDARFIYPVSFDGAPLTPPRPIPEYWPGHGFPERAPDAAPPQTFIPSPPWAPADPERETRPMAPPVVVPAPPSVPSIPPFEPVSPPEPGEAPKPAPPVAPPAPAPGPVPVPSPSPSPGQSPGPGLPEVGPIAPPAPAPLPPTTRPPWEEDFGDEVIGQPAERPAPTLPGVAEMTGKIEQKLRIINDKLGAAPDIPIGDPYARLVHELLTEGYGPGLYRLVGPCERLPDGTIPPPAESEWPGGVGPLGELSAKLDALASMIQAHKDQGQPVCVRQREGRKVTVLLREKR